MKSRESWSRERERGERKTGWKREIIKKVVERIVER